MQKCHLLFSCIEEKRIPQYPLSNNLLRYVKPGKPFMVHTINITELFEVRTFDILCSFIIVINIVMLIYLILAY